MRALGTAFGAYILANPTPHRIPVAVLGADMPAPDANQQFLAHMDHALGSSLHPSPLMQLTKRSRHNAYTQFSTCAMISRSESRCACSGPLPASAWPPLTGMAHHASTNHQVTLISGTKPNGRK